ncbi:putative holin [Buttiauxella massiliensis]|uniref:putative holin n=1 Tax=Buttiauxella massiliensis TaxID=2831590 RepID=UPI00125EA37E|nr:putative holin [Buttiauxella massiliensis]
MSAEPISGTATAHAVVTTVTFAGLWANTDAGVILGAFAGATLYVLTSRNLRWWEKLLYGLASFLAGLIGAKYMTAILNATLNTTLGKIAPGTEVIPVPESIGAMVAAAVIITFVLMYKSRLEKQTIAGEGK